MNHRFNFVKILRNASLCTILSLIFFVSFQITGIFQNDSWAADEYPSKEIKLVVPYSPGGAMDILARVFADKVEKILGVPVVVANNAAGGGSVGVLSVKQAKPDGYTLLAAPTGLIIMKPILTPDLPYSRTDVAPVCVAGETQLAIFVQNDAPWKNLKELVEYAKKNPGKLRAGVGQAGSFLQVLMDLFKAEAGVNIIDVPSTGGLTISAALLGGHVELTMSTASPDINFVKAGRLRALACNQKIPDFPTIKTFEEEGYPGVNLSLWYGIFAPKGLPNPILTKLTKAFQKACDDPSLKEQLKNANIVPNYLSPEETSKIVERDHEVTYKILKQTGVAK